MRRRLLSASLAIICVCLLWGCGSGGEQTMLTADAGGGITEKIIEPKDGDFSQEELEQYITAQIEAFQGGTVTMDSCKVTATDVEISMTYGSWKDYADFNQVVCFQGTLSEADTAGYDIGQTWLDKKGKPADQTVIRERAKEWKVLILGEPVRVKLPDKILYATDNVKITGRRTARINTVMADGSVPDSDTAADAEAEDETVTASSAVSGSPQAESPSVINRYATVADRYAYIIYK